MHSLYGMIIWQEACTRRQRQVATVWDRSRLFPVYQLNLLLIRSNTKTNSIFVRGFWLKCNCFVCLLMLWYILICVWSHHLVRSHSCIIPFTLKSWPNNSEYMRGINWMKSKYWSFTNCWNLISKGLLFIYQDFMDHHPKKMKLYIPGAANQF